jgi:hypothetical protein
MQKIINLIFLLLVFIEEEALPVLGRAIKALPKTMFFWRGVRTVIYAHILFVGIYVFEDLLFFEYIKNLAYMVPKYTLKLGLFLISVSLFVSLLKNRKA